MVYRAMSDEIITIARFDQPIDAHLARSRLESAGIKAIVINDGLNNLGLYHAVATGLVRLQVRAADREQALEALGVEPKEETPVQVRCLSCDSTRVSRRRFPIFFILICFLFSFLVRDLARPRWRCEICGTKW